MKPPARKKILLLVDWFYPGYKAGGPIQSCRNFAAAMEDSFDINVITSDRDLGDEQAYPGIKTNQWNPYSAHTNVFYAPALSLKQLQQLQKEVKADYVYLNSMFSPRFSLYPLLLKRLNKMKAKVILAPRGMLKPSALAFNPAKKKIFLSLFRLLALQKRIHFHATDVTEVADIRKNMGTASAITLISNFPGIQKDFAGPGIKYPGKLSMIFVGRIHPIKGLDLVLKSLQGVRAKIDFTIVAAIEDKQYWELCKELIAAFPANIIVNIKTTVPHNEMEGLLLQHQLFILATKGENFGHAIFESLSAGRPVLISDQTPWRNLSVKMAGWDLPLNNTDAFTAIIEQVAAMENEEYNKWCKGAWQYCHDFIQHAGIKQAYLKLFN